jgi:anti-sigma factor RsiW
MTSADRSVPMTCETFIDQADELAIGRLDGDQRSALLRHASLCSTCQAHLASLTAVTDQLLALAPEVEPPSGFEGRVLDHLTGVANPSRLVEQRRPGRRLMMGTAAAIVLFGVALSSFALGRRHYASHSINSATAQVVRSGNIVRADGSTSGHIALLTTPRPALLITVDSPKPFAGRLTCTLITADGTRHGVGTWSYDEVVSGAWSVGIDQSLLNSTSMEVSNLDGQVLASAKLTAT